MFNRIALALYVELKKINPRRLASWIKDPIAGRMRVLPVRLNAATSTSQTG
jgi:hypothetical protein